MANFCTNCGEKVDPSWNACPKCGSLLKKDDIPQPTPQQYPQPMQQPTPQPYQQPPSQYYQPRGGTSSGTLALIFGIIGLCCCGFIFGPLAIYYGNKGTREDEDKTMAQIGIVLGVIALICGCFWLLFVIFFFY